MKNRSDVKVRHISLEKAKFSYQGTLLNKDEFQTRFKDGGPAIMVAGTGLLEPNVVFAFDTKTEFHARAKTTPFADKFERLGQTEVVAQQANDDEVVVDRNGVVAVAKSTLYQNPGFKTTDKGPIHTTYPNKRASLGNFNDRTSSLKTINSTHLPFIFGFYEDVNWKGRTLFIIAGPGQDFELSDLHVFNFNDNISSVAIIVVPPALNQKSEQK